MKFSKIGVFFLITSILILMYVFYRSQIIYGGEKFDYYYPYYVISIISIVLFISLSFLKKAKQENINIIIISLIITLYSLEAFLYLRSNNKLLLDKSFDKRTKLEFYKDKLKQNPNAVVSVFPNYFLDIQDKNIFPLSGVSESETVTCNENGYFASFTSDRYGFNNKDDKWSAKKIDYLIFGDSFAYGECVFSDKNFAGNFERINKSIENVLNLGHSGSGPLAQYAILKEYFPKKKVDRVLWFYYEGNDLKNLKEELKDLILVQYIEDVNFKQNLRSNQNRINGIYKEIISETIKIQSFKAEKEKHLNISQFLKLFKLRYLISSFFIEDELNIDLSNFEKVTYAIKEFIDSKESKIYFIYLPSKTKYINPKFQYDFKKKEVINIIKKQNIPIIDIEKDFLTNYENPKLIVGGMKRVGHLNDFGYKEVTKEVLKQINKIESN